MVPTGSIYELSWRIRRGVLIRLAAGCVVGSLVLGAAPVYADWPTDVSIPEQLALAAPVVTANSRPVPPGGVAGELLTGGPTLWLQLECGTFGCDYASIEWTQERTDPEVPVLRYTGTYASIEPPPRDTCVPKGTRYRYKVQVWDAAGLTSFTEFLVELKTDLEPFEQGVFMLNLERGVPPSSDRLLAHVDSSLKCPELHGLRAEFLFGRLGDGVPPLTAQVAIPGTLDLSDDLGCSGQPRLLRASMVNAAGRRSPWKEEEVETPFYPAGLDELPVVPMVARCGEGARTTLEQTFPEGACTTPTVTWTQVSGPPLEQTPLSGKTVSLATRDTGLSSLVGESVVMQVVAIAGPGNAAGRAYTIPITVDPFVKVSRRTEIPAASETGLVGVSVDLFNTTSCDVEGVSYVERLEGLTYVEGSAKFNGQPVEATWGERALTVKGLTLTGDGTGTLTYVARPHLMGSRHMEGEAQLNDVPISLLDTPEPSVPDACGCTSSEAGPMLFAALGMWVAAVRRRCQ